MRLPGANATGPKFWFVPLIEFSSFRGRLDSLAKDRERRRFSVDAVTPERKAFVKDERAEEVVLFVRAATAGEAAGTRANACGR